MYIQYIFPVLLKLIKDLRRDLISNPRLLGKPIYITNRLRKLFDLSHISEITTDNLLDKIVNSENSFKLIDIRNKGYYNNLGHIKGAVSIPLLDLVENIDQLNEYKNEELIIICEVGNSSKFITHLLAHQGYKNLKNLAGGMSNWIEKGFTIEKPVKMT
jgi:rhodanese-related sulfurtransferase